MNAIISLGEYNGIEIGCRPEDQFINATAMCQATGKRWAAYWANKSTQEFLDALARNLRSQNSDFVISLKGGDIHEQGTWVHRRVAIHLAQWCSPDFAVWVSGQIENILLGKQVAHREIGEHQLAIVQNQIVVLQENYASLVGQLFEFMENQKKTNELFQEMLTTLKRIDERTQGKREGFSSEVKNKYVNCVYRYYQGVCPCCQQVRIVDASGKKVPHISEFEHYHHRSMNNLEHGWFVCKTCNNKLKNRKPDGFWFKVGPAFLNFQRLLHQRESVSQFIPGLFLELSQPLPQAERTASWLSL